MYVVLTRHLYTKRQRAQQLVTRRYDLAGNFSRKKRSQLP
jgi:hypothetical protein